MSPEPRPSDAERWRERLYGVMTDDERPLAAKQRRALEIGCQCLGVENGHVERIVDGGNTHEITVSVGEEHLVPEGMEIDRSKTFCRRTLEMDSALAVSDVFADGWATDPAYREQGVACYLGTPLYVDSETYGTVCFVSEDPREQDFDAGERAFVELLARLLGRELDAHRYEQRLQAREAELERREREREQSEQKYESLVTAAPDAIFLIDRASGRIEEANDAAAEMTGYDRATLRGMDHSALHGEDTERYRALLDDVADGETRDCFEDGTPLRIHCADGTTVPIEMSVTSVTLEGDDYLQGIVRDISDRREREAELRVKNRAIDTAGIGITIADAEEDLPIVYANDAFSDLTGYDAETILGENCRFLQGPETDPEVIDDIGAAIRNRETITRELLNYRADGTPFWNELTITPVEDETGEVTHFVGFQRDVSERKRRQRLVSVLNRVLRHNLRNKTNVVMGQAAHLEKRLDGDHAESLSSIEHAAADLAAISEKAHDLETVVEDRHDADTRDVIPAVTAAVEECRETTDEVSVEVDAPEHRRAFVPRQFQAALAELLENAVEHGCPDPQADPTVTVDIGTDDAGRATVAVSDDGPGLPENEQTVLRRGYETPLEHSSGLGLSLVAWIITGTGGDVTTTVEDGTTVTMHLPRPEDAA